ncbi:MAG: chromate transporter [Fusobacteriaceae bacterium]|jgi:chromate transporter|nr:chromate transporter [Fusobacteriaceae bacterium]
MLCLLLFLSFAKIAFFSFGGLTMVPVINDVVLRYGWMTPTEVMDIVAIAEMTPGSLGINCATFVGLRAGGIPGALSASLGAMVPSLTLCMVATYFIMRLRGNTLLETVMAAIRPVCLGMIFALMITLGKTTYFAATLGVRWNLVLIGVVAGFCLLKIRLTIPKTILISAVLGLLLG